MCGLTKLLESYSNNHQHPTNEFIHILAIPFIIFAILGLLSAVNYVLGVFSVVIATVYYVKLSKVAAIVMLLWLLFYLVLIELVHSYILEISLTLFLLGWVLQFIGHAIEGKKPSFFEDLRHLLIGPLFVAQKVCLKFGYKLFT